MVDVGSVTELAFCRSIERRDFFRVPNSDIEVQRDGGSGIVIRIKEGERYYFASFDYVEGPENNPRSYCFDGATSRGNRRRSSSQINVGRAVVDNILLRRYDTNLAGVLGMYLARRNELAKFFG